MLNFLAALALPLLWIVIVLGVTLLLSRFARGRLRNVLVHGGFQVNVAILLARTLWIAVWAVGILLVLYPFGVGLGPLAAFIGVVGLAASLSLQSVLQNMVAGVYLLAEQPFKIDDFINVIGPSGLNHEGKVEDIQIRTTQLRNADNELILVPNSAVFSGVVTNRTAAGAYVRHALLTFPRDSDPTAVEGRLRSVLEEVPSVLPVPQAYLRLDSVAREEWNARLTFWTSPNAANAPADVAWALAQAFPEARVNDAPAPAS